MIDTERQNRDALIRELEAAGATVRGNMISCPFHDDKHPSASVYRDEGGTWRFKCHGGECGFCGDIFDVRARATGRTLEDVLREAKPDTGRRKWHVQGDKVYATIQDLRLAVSQRGDIEAEYSYNDPDTNATELLVFRLRPADGGKVFSQAHPVKGGWINKAPQKPYPLYNRARVRAAGTVVVCEGEKCVHSLHDVGIVATTSPCGAGKAAYADWGPLAGKRLVCWPDNDKAGRAHMADVIAIVERLDPAPRISIIEPTDLDLGPKEDVADLIAQVNAGGGDARQAVLDALAKAQAVDPLALYRKRQAAIMRGEIRNVPWPWPELTRLTRALLPGRLTIIAGTKGAAKSFLMQACILYWLDIGEKVAVYIMEGSPEEYLDRSLAQLEANADFTNPDWQQQHPEDVQAATERHADELARLAVCVTRAPASATLEMVAEWVQAQAKDKRIVCIDPVTMAMRTGEPWVSDRVFVDAVKHTAEDSGCSVVLVSHMQKGAREGATDALAGSACYERFSDTIIQLHRHDAKVSTVLGPCGRADEEYNQTVFIEKARAPGTGYRLAYTFATSNQPGEASGPLAFRELGIIIKAKKGQ